MKSNDPARKVPVRLTDQVMLLFSILLLSGHPGQAQTNPSSQIGRPSWTAPEPVELGFINLGNGNLHIEIPLASPPQRGGVKYSAMLVYDSRIWRSLGTVWSPDNVTDSLGGWRFVTTEVQDGLPRVTYSQTAFTCSSGGQNYTWYRYNNYRLIEPDGTERKFFVIYETTNICHTPPGNTLSGPSIDAIGYWMNTSGPNVTSVFAPDGTQLYPNRKDSNGNYFDADSSDPPTMNTRDSLNRKPVIRTPSGSVVYYDVLNSLGTTSRYTLTKSTINVKTAFGQAGVTEYTGSFEVPTSIQLPDGTTYVFTYDSGTTPGNYGLLKTMKLPSGATITFNHSTFVDMAGAYNRWVSSRVSGGGTWSYSPALSCGANCQKVTVTKPTNDQSVYTFTLNNGSWNTLVEHFAGTAGGTMMQKFESVYDTSLPNPDAGGSAFIRRNEFITTDPGPGGNLVKKTSFTYDSFGFSWNGGSYTGSRGNATERREYAYGSGVAGALVRKNVSTYLNDCPSGPYCTKNIVNRVTNAQVQDSGGAKKSETITTYDSTSLTSATGMTHHDDTNFGTSMTTRGNPTVIQQWVSGSTYLSTTNTFDMTGQLRQTTDPKSQTTTFSYADNFFNDTDPVSDPPPTYAPGAPTNAYLTQVTLPVSGSQSFGYYWGSGNRAYSQDQNADRKYAHFTETLGRNDHEHLPYAGSSTCYKRKVYTSVAQHNFYQAVGTTPASPGCTGCRNDRFIMDTLGRTAKTSVVNDPQTQTDTDTSYDTSGRVLSVTNPYRGTPGGSETYAYDAINRVTSVAKTGGTANTYYGASVGGGGGRTTQLCSTVGYPTLYVDEAGKKRQSWTDGLGRVVEVDEPDASGSLTLGTCYSYDMMDDLTQVVQGSETRTYTFDGLSRMTAEATPEGGTTSYFFTTSGGALCAGDPKAVCRRTDARSITTTYTYDALNRPTGKTYSNGDPAVSYFYDQTSYNGLTITNRLGRRTGMSDASGQTAWSYDDQGNVLTERRTIGTVTKTISYMISVL